MHGLELVNEQIESVSRHVEDVDWSKHEEMMQKLDAEMATADLLIRTLLFAHDSIIQLDSFVFEQIEAGKMHADRTFHEAMIESVAGFKDVGGRVLACAEAFTRKGIPLTNLALLRYRLADPACGLKTFEMAMLAKSLDQGEGQNPAEIDFDDAAYVALSVSGNRASR